MFALLFPGAYCDELISPCDWLSPCDRWNTAKCVDSGTSEDDYLCVCKAGWTGVVCSVDIDECSSSPCLNSATCINLINGSVSILCHRLHGQVHPGGRGEEVKG